jgi:hypothetical protein
MRGSIARTRLRSFHKEADPGSAVSPGDPGSSLAGSLGYTDSQWFTMVFDDGRTLITRLWLIPLEAQIMLSACNRRDFTRAALTGAAAVSMPAVARAGRVIGANDHVRIGLIGVGYRGVQVLYAFGAHKDAEIASLCDVYEPYLNGQFDKIHPHFKKLGYVVPSRLPDLGGALQRHTDFRRVLD